MTFTSKRDWWLVGIVLVALASMCRAAVDMAVSPEPLAVCLLILALLVAVTGFIAWSLVTTSYAVTKRDLVVRSGPCRWSIALTTIQSVEPSHNIVASPAWSLDRLEITYDGGFILISPRDKAGFLAALTAACPALISDGERAVRAEPRAAGTLSRSEAPR